MTLVVARNARGTVHVLADSLVSGPGTNRRQPEYALKVFSVGKNILICYSGSPEVAHAAIVRVWPHLEREDCEAAISLLAQVEGAEFLLVHKDAIIRVRQIEVSRCLPIEWIGDPAAWRRFRAASLTFDARPESNTWSAVRSAEDGRLLRSAFEEVVSDQTISSVGGPVVVATSGASGSAYLNYAELTSPRVPTKSGAWNTIDFGDASRGGFGFTTITPRDKGYSGWGRFYFQGFMGFYFYADPTRNLFVRYDGQARTADEFCSALTAQVGHGTCCCAQLG